MNVCSIRNTFNRGSAGCKGVRDMNVNIPKEYVDRLREKAKNGTLTEDEQLLLVEIIAGKPDETVKGKPKVEPVRERKVVTAPAEVHTVATELTNDDIAMLRMKAKRNELTDDERMIYAEYLRMMQARGDWYPGKDSYEAYRQASGERYEAERERNKKRKSNTWSSFLIALVVAPFVFLSALFLWSAYESGDISWPDFSNTNEPAHTIEDIGESTNDDSSWFDFFDWGSPVSSDGRQTIEDLGNGTILIDE